ncbi:S24 family peptidase [Roseobacter sp. OBYS 0001]|uniref:S24 family peptidase n=1 Tax=Roseobacter sp. OBYS 0001 TaxID=882651 RepID=UPI001BC2B8DA|nr:S24 family peptidase [Roseobacter sp. OBYS 0001]GIT85443.1 hypothetical protein ROBYS_04590 [Roseobacter sp. OBYS 0001]
MTQAQVGKLAFGKASDTAFQNIRRGAWPSVDRLKSIGDVLGLEFYFGPARVIEGPSWEVANGWSESTVPFIGLAKCSVKGWADDFRERDPLPKPAWIDDEKSFWVMATGQSMEREGIISGDHCLVSPDQQPRIGDRVFIRDALGAVAIKRLIDMNGRTVRLRGWQPIEDEAQKEFLEERPLKMVKELFPVVAVYRGKPGSDNHDAVFIPDPRAPGLPRHDGMVLVEIMIDSLKAGRFPGVPSTLGFHERWLHANGIAAKNAALVAAIDDEMEPTLGSHSIALINRALVNIEANQIYAIRREKKVLLRRLEVLMGGVLIIRGDNPTSQSDVLPPERAGDIEIIGKVIWSGHHS